MAGDDLKHWLVALGLGGGLAVAGADRVAADAGRIAPDAAAELPRAELEREPLYVVINREERYSIWPAPEKLPRGWRMLHEAIDLDGALKRFPRIGDQRFKVVGNDEGQYSIWPVDRALPRGFQVPPSLRERRPCRIDECGRLLDELDGGP